MLMSIIAVAVLFVLFIALSLVIWTVAYGLFEDFLWLERSGLWATIVTVGVWAAIFLISFFVVGPI